MNTILVVVADDALLDNISEILDMAHYEVIPVSNAYDALQRTKGKIPDLMISDMLFPGITGPEVLMNIRKETGANKLQAIFLTSKSGHEDHLNAIGSEAMMFITKPFDGDDLLLAIQHGLNTVRSAA